MNRYSEDTSSSSSDKKVKKKKRKKSKKKKKHKRERADREKDKVKDISRSGNTSPKRKHASTDSHISSPKRPPRLNLEASGSPTRKDNPNPTKLRQKASPGRPKDKVWQHFIVEDAQSSKASHGQSKQKHKPTATCRYCSETISAPAPKLLRIHISRCKAALRKGVPGGGVDAQERSSEEEEEDESEVDIFECERGCGFENESETAVEKHEETCTFVKRKRGRPRKRKPEEGAENGAQAKAKAQAKSTKKKAKREDTKVQEASDGDTTDEEAEFKTITLYCKRDFLRALRKSKDEEMAREKQKEVRSRRSINSMSEAEQLKLALAASLKTR